MRLWEIFSVLLMLISVSVTAGEAQDGSKIAKRRVCAQIFSLEVKSIDDVEKQMREIKKAGIDTVIIRAFQNRGDRIYPFITPKHREGVYFATENAPVVADVLGKLVEIAHRQQLDAFAWMTTRYADYGIDSSSDYKPKSYNFETKRIDSSRGLNLFHPGVITRLEGIYRDLGRYPIDGILFQDDLILKHNEDFSPEASLAFLKEFGYAPRPDFFYIDPFKSGTGKYYVNHYTERFWTWANWKSRWLMGIAQRLMKAARESNPSLQFAINIYYETVLNSANGVAWFSQSLSEAKRVEFDYFAVMAYHRQTMHELGIEENRAIQLMVEATRKALLSVGIPGRVMIKAQSVDWKSREIIGSHEMNRLLRRILEQGEVSLAFVPYVSPFPYVSLKGKWVSPQK